MNFIFFSQKVISMNTMTKSLTFTGSMYPGRRIEGVSSPPFFRFSMICYGFKSMSNDAARSCLENPSIAMYSND